MPGVHFPLEHGIDPTWYKKVSGVVIASPVDLILSASSVSNLHANDTRQIVRRSQVASPEYLPQQVFQPQWGKVAVVERDNQFGQGVIHLAM